MVYGLIGSGKTTLAETLFGARHTYHAEIDGQTIKIKHHEMQLKRKLHLYPKKEENKACFLQKIL